MVKVITDVTVTKLMTTPTYACITVTPHLCNEMIQYLLFFCEIVMKPFRKLWRVEMGNITDMGVESDQ